MEPHFIDNEERQRLRAKIEKEVSAMGYPPEFGTALAAGLGTERAMGKMLHYLTHADMPSMEEIADEWSPSATTAPSGAKRKKRNSIRTSTTKCSGRANSKTMKMNKKQEIENRKGLRE